MITVSDKLRQVEEYYFSKKLKEVSALKANGKPIINLGIGSPDLPPSPLVIQSLLEAVNDDDAHQYQSYIGLQNLRESLAHFYQKHFNVTLNPENQVLPLMGSKEGIMHISMAFLNQGDAVLIPNPGYPTYESVTKLVEANPMYYNLLETNGWFPDLDVLEQQDLSKVKIMWVNYPNMPTGKQATEAQLQQLVDFALRHQILVVNDNPYSFILNDNKLSILSVKGSESCCLELNSMSKTFNISGWRIGFVLGSEYLLKSVLQVKSNMDSGMFYGIQKGAVTALSMSTDWLDNLNEAYNIRRELVWKIADKLHCTYEKNTSGLFVWGKLPKGKTSKEFSDDLLYSKHIFIVPGTVFGSNGEGYVRFSLCVKENDLESVLSRLKK